MANKTFDNIKMHGLYVKTMSVILLYDSLKVMSHSF